MLNNKRFSFVCAALAAVLLSGCAVQAERAITGDAAFQAAVRDGYISEIADSVEGETVYEMAEVEVKDLSRVYEVQVKLYAPVHRDLFFERDGGRLKGVYVEQGARVSKGDLLAEVTFDQVALQAEREQFILRQKQFEREFSNEDADRRNAIEKMKNALTPDMSDTDLELHALRLTKLELEYEQFLYRSSRTRKDLDKQLVDIDERVAGEQIVAPFGGIVRYASAAKEGSLIRNWTRMVSIDNDDLLQLTAEGAIDIVRYGDVFNVVNLKNDKIHFEACVVSDPIATDTRLGTYTFVLEPTDRDALFKLLEDNDIDFYKLVSMTLTGQPLSYDIKNALVVPKSAVRSEDAKQFVNLYEDGVIKKRYVVTGITQIGETQILDGLEAGQQVVLTN